MAERYSLGLKDAWQNAKEAIYRKLKRNITSEIRLEHSADHVRSLVVTTEFHNITYKYLLLPVWISNFKYNDKVYQFMVNGQTGKVAGRTPLSIPKIILATLGVIAIIAAFLYLKM